MADADELSQTLRHLAAVGTPKPKQDAFAQKTPEFKSLHELFKDGIIEATDKPGDICHSHGVFQKHITSQICLQFSKLKKDVGVCARTGKLDIGHQTSVLGFF